MTIDASMLENLRDAGCDEGMIERYREIAANNGQYGTELIRLLTPYRKALLDALHEDQAKLDCLDYLLFKLRNAQEKGMGVL
jgi:hypothetical protein